MTAAQRDGGPGVAAVITRDCGYGFSGYALMGDGTQAFHTTRLHPTVEEAQQEVRAAARTEQPE